MTINDKGKCMVSLSVCINYNRARWMRWCMHNPWPCQQWTPSHYIWYYKQPSYSTVSQHFHVFPNMECSILGSVNQMFQTFARESCSLSPPLSKMFWALGCQMTRPTRRWCATKSATGSMRFSVSPPSGICQTLTVQSSDPLAIRSSSCGHHWMSNTAALCPTTSGASRSTRPTWNKKQTD